MAVTGTGYECKWDGTLWDNGASTFEVIPKNGAGGCRIDKIDNVYNQCWGTLGDIIG